MPADERTQAAWELVELTVEESRRALGDRFASAYAIGSLAHGGFAAAVSDIDVAILATPGAGVAAEIGAAAARVQQRVGAEPASRLSIFHAPWPLTGPPDARSRFPAIDRLDLISHGTLLAGEDRREREATAPSAEEVRREAIEFALRALHPERLAMLDLERHDLRTITKIVLAPVRLLSLVETARVEGNDAAAAHYLGRGGGGDTAGRELVEAALEWRRQGRIEHPDHARRLLAEGAAPLHAEVLSELAGRSDIPHTTALLELAAEYRDLITTIS